jgi:intracellular sulfur oxidation DsrE/DsrF family protein
MNRITYRHLLRRCIGTAGALPYVFICLNTLMPQQGAADGKIVQTPYEEQKVVFDFYFDDPERINSALYWIRALVNPLMDEPYNQAPEFMNIVVVIHGTEIVTTIERNYKKYKEAVERMKYYAALGIKFRVCGLAAADFGYSAKDFYDFIELAPSAITELAHWQLKGYALITPQIRDKKFSIEEIR